MKKTFFLTLFLPFWVSLLSWAQPVPTTSKELTSSLNEHLIKAQESPFAHYPARSVGPVVMSGRVTDIAVTSSPKVYYVAYASGGLFKTINNGQSFTPVFDLQGALGMGDIALAPSDDAIIWVGTGEKNSSRSSYAGSGVYKSLDAGETWKFMGLPHSQHISRILIHPSNPDIVWVAVIGSLYSENEERGIFKTTDGGLTWEKTLFIDTETGIIDMVIDPSNPDHLLAASWQRMRKAWNFTGNGKHSTIYKSTDGGSTWTPSNAGFPSGDDVGRIGLAVSASNPSTIYALLDNQRTTKTEKETDDALTYASFSKMTMKEFDALADSSLTQFLKSNGFPKKYTASSVREGIRKKTFTLTDIANYSGDANEALFNTDVTGGEVYRSDDGGTQWKKVNSYPLEGLYFTYGYYFGEIRVDPSDSETVYILGVPFLKSSDGGKTWKRIDHSGVHVDHQTLWINPADSQHLLLGNDGGVYSSYDGGEHWTHHNSPSVGQFYTVMVDNASPYNIYGGLQDNGVHTGPSTSVPGKSKHWESIMGGDGMHVAVHPEHPEIVYTGYQFGNYYRMNRKSGDYAYITPKHDIGTPSYRFNWNTPLIMSKHNPEILYMGSQKVLRTLNGGRDWSEISPDLTQNKEQGNVPYSTISSLSESPLTFGLLWVGTDDGKVHLSRNSGASWEDVSNGLPSDLWVSKIVASPFNEGEAFLSLTGYRFDHFDAYAYHTEDYGKTWKKVSEDLPNEAVNILLPDTEVEGLWFAGTDYGTYLTLNAGKHWERLRSIPNVASYDMIIQERESDLVVGTHGRSIYVVELEPLRTLARENDPSLLLFALAEIPFSNRWGEARYPYQEVAEPEISVMFYSDAERSVTLSVLNAEEKAVYKTEIDAKRGVNSFVWNGKLDKKESQYVSSGTYEIQLRSKKLTDVQPLVIRSRSSRTSARPGPSNPEPGVSVIIKK